MPEHRRRPWPGSNSSVGYRTELIPKSPSLWLAVPRAQVVLAAALALAVRPLRLHALGGALGGGGGGTTTVLSTLSVGISNKGVVKSDIGGINCGGGGSCSARVNQGSVVTLTATPPTGLAFIGWSGACSGTSSVCTIAITSDTKVQAAFSK